jgi:hypothetical protein
MQSDKYNISQNNTQIKTIAALNFNILVSSKIKKKGPIIKLKKIPQGTPAKISFTIKIYKYTLLFFYDSPSKKSVLY